MFDTQTEILLSSKDLAIGYKQRGGKFKSLLNKTNLQLRAGQIVGLIGANGVGKSTLLRTLAGLQKTIKGNIFLQSNDLAKLNARQIATRIALVLTERTQISNLTVEALIAIGRSPHTNWLGQITTEDNAKIQQALEICQITHLAQRQLPALSDGERQKVMIARALVQDTALIMLDEPSNHLDLPNRVMIFKLLREVAHQQGKGILLSTHDLDLAIQSLDYLWLIDANQQKLYQGSPEDLILSGHLPRIFQSPDLTFDLHKGRFQMHSSPLPLPISIKGSNTAKFWLAQALLREGFTPKESSGVSRINIQATMEDNKVKFDVYSQSKHYKYLSVSQVIKHLKRFYSAIGSESA